VNKLFVFVFAWFMSFSMGAVWMSGVWTDFIIAEDMAAISDAGRVEWFDCKGRLRE